MMLYELSLEVERRFHDVMGWVGPIEVLQVDGPMDLFTRRRRNSASFDSVRQASSSKAEG